MNDDNDQVHQPNDETCQPHSESPDREDIIVDGPWDDTVRPARPSLLPLLRAAREAHLNPYGPPGELPPDDAPLPQSTEILDVDIVVDGPWDDTVRPVRPSLLPHILAARMQLDNPTRSRREILAELSRLSVAELEKLRDELCKPGPQSAP